MNQKNTDPIVRSLVKAFIPVVVNRDINQRSIRTAHISNHHHEGTLSIVVRVMLSQAIPQLVGFEPTHAAIVFDIDFKDCIWSDELGCYEWLGGIYAINIAGMGKNVLWANDHGQPLQIFNTEDNKNLAQKVLTDLFASVNPRVARLFLDAVLASEVKTTTQQPKSAAE